MAQAGDLGLARGSQSSVDERSAPRLLNREVRSDEAE
jgi:hypothetical protein